MLALNEASKTDPSKLWNMVNNINYFSVIWIHKIFMMKLQNALKMPDQEYFDRSFEQECVEFLKLYDDGELKFKHNVFEHGILNGNFSCEEIDYAGDYSRVLAPPMGH